MTTQSPFGLPERDSLEHRGAWLPWALDVDAEDAAKHARDALADGHSVRIRCDSLVPRHYAVDAYDTGRDGWAGVAS